MKNPVQMPAPGSHILLNRGDLIEFSFTLDENVHGRVWLRTNIGNSHILRREIIRHIENDEPLLARGWHDIKMHKTAAGHFSLKLPLTEVGCFDAKAFFIEEGSHVPVWPEGGNTIVKVEPAEYCCSDTVYCAFVRQFGPNRYRHKPAAGEEKAVKLLDSENYNVIPRSGTFRDLIRQLDFIMGKMHFRMIQLLPIHPTPSVYARMGRFGSPYAGLNFKKVDAAMAEFDRKTTPLDQFKELIDAVHTRCGKLLMDIPINHTGWASSLQMEHPEWFARGADREFQSPGAWGVTWADLSKLDYSHRGLWHYMADVFLYWCRQGVDGFRCDAGYMIPCGVWEYIAAKVREEYPDTVFLLEGLGGSIEIMETLLCKADLNWAYSELFQNYDQQQIESYLAGAMEISTTKGTLVHFAETHDNDRLAAKSHRHAELRTALAAMCSHNGAFGITNGVEWFADEKIDVHGAPALNWENGENQVARITRLNAILESHPAFHAGAKLRMLPHTGQNSIALARSDSNERSRVLALVNLDEEQSSKIGWERTDFACDHAMLHDLLTGRQIGIEEHDQSATCTLGPGEVLCLCAEPGYLAAIDAAVARAPCFPERSEAQRLKAKALEIWKFFNANGDTSGLDAQMEAEKLRNGPRDYCAALAATKDDDAPPVTCWQWPRDSKRTVMVPPGHFLCVKSPAHFTVEITDGAAVLRHEMSLVQKDGSHFALISPLAEPKSLRELELVITTFDTTPPQRVGAPVLYLTAGHNARVFMHFQREDAMKLDCYAICTNGRGAMAQVRSGWGEIQSKYDALLAGNLNPNFPVDRHVMFTRCRAWLVYRGLSQEINRNCLLGFSTGKDGEVSWQFEVPSSMGKFVLLHVSLRMPADRNTVVLSFHRQKTGKNPDGMDDAEPVSLILRPDVEDRSCHETTKAYAGPETSWHNAVGTIPNGFVFGPSREHRLTAFVSSGTFTQEHQWQYMVATPFDEDRGLDRSTDIFSPGYFTLFLKGGETTSLQADILTGSDKEAQQVNVAMEAPTPIGKSLHLIDATRAAIPSFVVKRDEFQTVIAGYPWFLDWGRDTLICLRGMIAAGMKHEAREILKQFARFESRGTIPNMIRGNDDSNRDTSDAPLWFFVACSDLFHSGDHAFLNADCAGRTIRQVLHSIASSYIEGTPNGIVMDRDSGLIFSPPHFTWMDTNHPAGTPREGYPVEIQALWHAALQTLAQLEHDDYWSKLAEQVRGSIEKLFRSREFGYLSDCLHATRGTPAAKAVADDALRPNQLLAITLGAVEDQSLHLEILSACEELLVPGAIRSLADRPVRHSLSIRRGGALLNDPTHPYWGEYRGDEDTRRKPAYHNGTAWTWIFPSYCEAMFMTHGESSRETALAILASGVCVINRGCIGQVPEVLDGNTPHALRGCGAQAWGVTELHRVLAILTRSA